MEYKTVAGGGEYSVTINRSQFIGYASSAPSEEAAVSFIEKIRRRHSDARHNVYAYIIDKNRRRYSDDAEPQGTAGLPVLGVIEAGGLQNTVIVVTRYFGGILLGTGGLVRAYTEAAAGAARNAGTVIMAEANRCFVNCQYSDYSSLNFSVAKSGGKIINSDFSDSVSLEFELETGKVEPLRREITELTSGRVLLKSDPKIFFMKKPL